MDVAASSGPPERPCLVHQKLLLVQQHTGPDELAIPPVKEGAKQTQFFIRLSPYLVDVRWPGQPCIKDYPKGICCFDPLYWLFEKLNFGCISQS
jgi:hypothetical protein